MISLDEAVAISTIAGYIVTSIGVGFIAWQIRLQKKQSQADFEDNLDKEYRQITIALPVDVLLGKKPHSEKSEEVRNLIYNYLDLCNEQICLRAKGRISKLTWISWCVGMKIHLNSNTFLDVYKECSGLASWTYLTKLVESDFKTDPNTWY